MMNAFEQARIIEKNAMQDLEPFIKRHATHGNMVVTEKGRLSRMLQKTAGDVLINDKKGEIIGIEIKAEENMAHGNFFLENWSNKSRETPG